MGSPDESPSLGTPKQAMAMVTSRRPRLHAGFFTKAGAGFFTKAGAYRVCSSHSSRGFFYLAVLDIQLVRWNGFIVASCLWLACFPVFVAPPVRVAVALLVSLSVDFTLIVLVFARFSIINRALLN
jgi:hypothetical protein